MFVFPSVWNLIVSTIVFFIAVHYLRQWLTHVGLSTGVLRGLLVFLMASIIAWPAGEVADWLHDQMRGEAVKQSSPTADLSQLLAQIQQLKNLVK